MNKIFLITFCLLVLFVRWPSKAVERELATALEGHRTPTHVVHRAASRITIDGKLNEAAWQSAKPLRKFVFPWWKQGKKEQTTVRVLYDNTHLYVAYQCEDAHISATRKGRDSAVYRVE